MKRWAWNAGLVLVVWLSLSVWVTAVESAVGSVAVHLVSGVVAGALAVLALLGLWRQP